MMAADLNTTLNQLETRVAQLEAKALGATTGLPDIVYDEEAGTTTVEDRLDWSVTEGWEPYASVTPGISDETDPDYPGTALTSFYGRPEAYQIGRMCFLTGTAKRKVGSTSLAAGQRHNLKMFGLPADLRPLTHVILPCLMGNGPPEDLTTVGTAWVEIRNGADTGQDSAQVYYVAGTVALSATTGWVALQGIFTCQTLSAEHALTSGSWDDVHFMTTWDTVNPESQWDTYSPTD